MKPKLEPPKKILLTRSDRIGDLVLTTPVFKAVREKFPKAWLSCLTLVENREIVEGNPYLDEVILYNKKGSEKSWLGNLLFARMLSKKKFDVAIHFHATNRMHGLTWLAGIPHRIGWDRKLSWALTYPVPETKKEGIKHEAHYNFDLLKFWDIPCPEVLEAYFPLNLAKKLSLEKLLEHHQVPEDKTWIVIHPSASCPSKRWPGFYFSKLMNLISEKKDAVFLLIGTREDRNLIQEIRNNSKALSYDLSGRLNLGMLAQLFKKSELLISNDSGPVHIAATIGTPVIAIFGRKQPGLSPTRWRPVGEDSAIAWKDVGCETCLAHLCKMNFLCLEAVLPEDVLIQAETLLRPLSAHIRP